MRQHNWRRIDSLLVSLAHLLLISVACAISVQLAGCGEAAESSQVQVTQTIDYKYSIVWVNASTVNWYYADEIRYEGPWMIFRDKSNNNTTTRLPAANVAIYGGE